MGPALLMRDASVVVVTYNALPWVEQCVESVRDEQVVVVDNGSTDGTPDVVRELFPQACLIERENLGLASGWNAGMAAVEGRYILLLNADAWLADGSLAQLVAFADAHPEAAVVGPRLLNPDGTLQRSVRGFPTLWRLATEYLFLRKLAPRSRLLNAFYEGVHAFRSHGRLLSNVFILTFTLQAIRVLSIWAVAKAVGIDLSPLVYYVMGPLFFLVLLVPFTLNGFAVREAFFVSFLGQLAVDADAAFAAGFLFFLVTVAMALPGGAILLWEGLRGGAGAAHA